jgi:hypothetical protein
MKNLKDKVGWRRAIPDLPGVRGPRLETGQSWLEAATPDEMSE